MTEKHRYLSLIRGGVIVIVFTGMLAWCLDTRRSVAQLQERVESLQAYTVYFNDWKNDQDPRSY